MPVDPRQYRYSHTTETDRLTSRDWLTGVDPAASPAPPPTIAHGMSTIIPLLGPFAR